MDHDSGVVQLHYFWLTAFHEVVIKMLIWSVAIFRLGQGLPPKCPTQVGVARRFQFLLTGIFHWTILVSSWLDSLLPPKALDWREWNGSYDLFHERVLEAMLHTICNILLVTQDISIHWRRGTHPCMNTKEQEFTGCHPEGHPPHASWHIILPFLLKISHKFLVFGSPLQFS